MTRSNLTLGVGALIVAAIGIFIWVPADTGTGLIVHARRQVSIGDALAPVAAFGLLFTGGLLLIMFERKLPDQPRLDLRVVAHVGSIVLLIALSFFVMVYAGPALVWLVNTVTGQELTYRLLRASMPWKYVGFCAGGALLVAGTMALSEGRLRWRMIIIAVLAAVVLALLYDLPFKDLLLPPNGDV